MLNTHTPNSIISSFQTQTKPEETYRIQVSFFQIQKNFFSNLYLFLIIYIVFLALQFRKRNVDYRESDQEEEESDDFQPNTNEQDEPLLFDEEHSMSELLNDYTGEQECSDIDDPEIGKRAGGFNQYEIANIQNHGGIHSGGTTFYACPDETHALSMADVRARKLYAGLQAYMPIWRDLLVRTCKKLIINVRKLPNKIISLYLMMQCLHMPSYEDSEIGLDQKKQIKEIFSILQDVRAQVESLVSGLKAADFIPTRLEFFLTMDSNKKIPFVQFDRGLDIMYSIVEKTVFINHVEDYANEIIFPLCKSFGAEHASSAPDCSTILKHPLHQRLGFIYLAERTCSFFTGDPSDKSGRITKYIFANESSEYAPSPKLFLNVPENSTFPLKFGLKKNVFSVQLNMAQPNVMECMFPPGVTASIRREVYVGGTFINLFSFMYCLIVYTCDGKIQEINDELHSESSLEDIDYTKLANMTPDCFDEMMDKCAGAVLTSWAASSYHVLTSIKTAGKELYVPGVTAHHEMPRNTLQLEELIKATPPLTEGGRALRLSDPIVSIGK
jgi:hypothetical protein